MSLDVIFDVDAANWVAQAWTYYVKMLFQIDCLARNRARGRIAVLDEPSSILFPKPVLSVDLRVRFGKPLIPEVQSTAFFLPRLRGVHDAHRYIEPVSRFVDEKGSHCRVIGTKSGRPLPDGPPIDTRAIIPGNHREELVFATLIGYLRRGEACVGVIGAHALGETVYAAAGQGCWCRRDGSDPQRVWASAVIEPAEAFVVSTGLEHTDLDPRDPQPSIGLSRLYRQARQFRWSGDCINYALLCQGRIDVALDPRMNPWDIAAVVPCVREAGGVLSSLDGNEDVVWQPDLVASANPTLHAKVLQSLRPA